MKRFYLLFFLLFGLKGFGATLFWDGGGGDNLWGTSANWVGNVVPVAGDDVVLDNLNGVAGTYTVTLPNTAVTIQSITITPNIGNNITLILPSTNILQPGLTFSGPANSNVLVLNNGGVFRNSTGAPNSSPNSISISTTDTIRINNGGKYLHNTARSHAYLVDQLSRSPGTETGIFEFDPPSVLSLSLPGNVFGTLSLLATANGGTNTYIGSAASPVTIRGNLEIGNGVSFNPSVTSNFLIGRDLIINGGFSWNPTNSGTSGRSLFFNGDGTKQVVRGTGSFLVGPFFRNLIVSSNAVVEMQRNFTSFSADDSIIVQPNATLIFTGENTLSGTGSIFFNDTLSTLKIASASGITASGATGHVQTDTRNFSKKAYYYYNGTAAQATGSGLPDSVYRLFVQNPADVTLSSQLCVQQQLGLDSGHLFTTVPTRIKLAVGGLVTSQGTNNYGSANQGNNASFVSGPVIIETNTTDTITFPIGKIGGGVFYAPVKLKPFNTTVKEYRAEYFPAQHVDVANVAPSLNRVSEIEYWDISSNLSTSPDIAAKVSLSWRPNSAVGTGNPADSATALQDLVVAHYFNDGMGLSWNMDGVLPTFTIRPNSTLSYGFVTTDGFTGGFSPFTFGSRSSFNILPLTLVSFSGTYRNGLVDLTWLTQQERQLVRYEVEKSTDGSRFSKISTLTAANNTGLQTYADKDANTLDGWNYYRLKVIDNQQHSYYTAAIKVWVGKTPAIAVGPNPAQDFLKIVLPASSNYNLAIVNEIGQVVKRVTNAQGPVTVDIKSLNKGMYFMYILPTNRQAIVHRFVKQ